MNTHDHQGRGLAMSAGHVTVALAVCWRQAAGTDVRRWQPVSLKWKPVS